MEIPKTEFESLSEIKKFLKMNKTDYANYYVKLIKDHIKIIGKEQDVYFYDEKIKLWKCETKEVYDAFMADYLNETGKSLFKCYKTLAKKIKKDKKLKKSIKEKQTLFDSAGFISTIITRSTGKLQDNKFVTKLNVNPDFLPIQNGKKIDLRTGQITERTKEDYFSYECPVTLTDKLEHAEKFFSQVMPKTELREYLRKVLGYCLTGNMDARCFFIWYGDGSNGKSVIMKLLKCILGALYHQCGKGIFMKGSQEKAEGASPDKVALIGVRNGVYSEGDTADNIDINESFLRMVTGKDEINARALFRAPLTFFPICKLHLLSNYKPDLNGDKAMRERVRYLFFNSSFVDTPDSKVENEFKKDDDFIDSLCGEYLSEVFSWIVKGSIEYYKTKSIIPPEEFKNKTNEFFDLQDSITSYIASKLIVTENEKDYIKRGTIFETYRQYCNDNSQRCHPRSTLFKRLEDLKIRITKKDGYDVYRGIKLATLEGDYNDEDYEYGIEKKDQSVKQSFFQKKEKPKAKIIKEQDYEILQKEQKQRMSKLKTQHDEILKLEFKKENDKLDEDVLNVKNLIEEFSKE